MSDTDRMAASLPLAAASAGLQRLKRVTWGSVLQVALLVFAVSVMVSTVTGLDVDQLTDDLRAATWWLVAIAFLVAQIPRLSQTVSALGAATRPLPARPVYLLQLAQGYVGFAMPASAARVAMNVRFFQKQGFSAGAALAKGLLDSFAGFVIEETASVQSKAASPSAWSPPACPKMPPSRR